MSSPRHAWPLGLVALISWFCCGSEAATLVAPDSMWRMRKGTNEVSTPIEAWRSAAFEDTAWPQAPAPFHFGEGAITGGTRLGDMRNNYNGIFLRRSFTVTEPSELVALTLSAACDDGFVAWINGTEVVRYRINAGEVAISTLANSSAPEPIEFIDHTIADPARFLVERTNVLAVQAFNRLKDNGDFQINVGLVSHRLDNQPPALAGVSPAPGLAGDLTTIVVEFTEPVTGVNEEDLLMNSVPAERVRGTGTAYTFTFRPPAYGVVTMRWTVGHGIVDLALPPNRFVPTGEAAEWTYTHTDFNPPKVLSRVPPPDAAVRRLTQVALRFDEPVTGLDASDLLANGQPAAALSGIGAGPFVFAISEPQAGTVHFSWAAAHGITDRATPPNDFAGQGWTCALDPDAPPPTVVINELCAANVSGHKDEDGDAEDWIELRNSGAASVDLTGWALTDDPDIPDKWILRPVTLGGGQFLVIFASGKDRAATGAGARLHTNFKLADEGEYLGLYDAGSPRAVVSEFAPRFPEARNDYSYGLGTEGAGRYFSPPTPGAANGSSSITGVVSQVELSLPHGFYDAPFDLTLSNATVDSTIRYTADGSEPTSVSGFVYIAPIRVAQSMIVRAGAFSSNSLPSRVETRTYLFPATVFEQPSAPPGFPGVWGSIKITAADYAMDPRVTGDPGYADRLRPGLMGLPTLSLVMPVDDWFSVARGIYSNGQREGIAWERRCSAELLMPDGEEGFQVNCGVRIQGGTSPNPWNDYKLSMRMVFRSDYGPGRLDHEWFPDSPVGSFNTLILDAGYNYTWSYGGGVEPATQRERAQYVRDQFACDLQAASGAPASFGRYVHLFLNGLYWGVYDVHEEPEAVWAADHYGGDPDEYDVIKHTGSNVLDGNGEAWNVMMSLARADPANPETYDALARMLDLPGLIDYLLVHFYIGNTDWPHHNWYAFRRRIPNALWRFVSYDSEHCLKEVTHDRTGVSDANTPGELYSRLRSSPEFRLLFADRVHRHFFNGGVYFVDSAYPAWNDTHPERNRPAALYHRRIAEIDPAIVLESARWGDNQRPAQPFTRDKEWMAELNRLRTGYFPQRSATVLNRLRTLGLYPSVAAPAFNRHGGVVPRPFELAMSAPAGVIYHTVDGTDPRLPGSGAAAPGAQVYASGMPLLLMQSTHVKARALVGTAWSALTEATFRVGDPGMPLRPSEVMYNPPGGGAFEFIELHNASPVPLDVSGFTLQGIQFPFPPGSVLRPHEVIVLASDADPAAFAARYPGVVVWGTFKGALSNSGEDLRLKDAGGRLIWLFEYSDANGWPPEADGRGHSMEIIDLAGALSDPANWRASEQSGGSPGTVTQAPPIPIVRLNEVMASNPTRPSASPAASDWVELCSTGPAAIDLSGWSLSDSEDPRRFLFPAGTTLAPGSFLLVWCNQAPGEPGLHTGFGLDREGETLFLYDAQTNRIDAITFGNQIPEFSLGRAQDGSWQLADPTPGAPNAPAPTTSLSSAVLNEWLANPLPGDGDWLELYNRSTDQPLDLRGLHLAIDDALFTVRTVSFIPPGGHLRLWCAVESGPGHVEFKLPAAGGSIRLMDADGSLIDEVVYAAQNEDQSSGRLPDGSPQISALGALTPGLPNASDPARSDRDGDGLPDAWELANGLDPRSSRGNDGATGDPDGDIFTNLAEFLALTDPQDPASALAILSTVAVPGGVEIVFRGVATRSYRLEWAVHLAGPWTTIETIGPLESSRNVTLTDREPGPTTTRFYRLGLDRDRSP